MEPQNLKYLRLIEIYNFRYKYGAVHFSSQHHIDVGFDSRVRARKVDGKGISFESGAISVDNGTIGSDSWTMDIEE